MPSGFFYIFLMVVSPDDKRSKAMTFIDSVGGFNGAAKASIRARFTEYHSVDSRSMIFLAISLQIQFTYLDCTILEEASPRGFFSRSDDAAMETICFAACVSRPSIRFEGRASVNGLDRFLQQSRNCPIAAF